MRIGVAIALDSFAPSGFVDPTSLPNLLLWLRGDKGVTLNAANVSAWADQSGTGDANKNAAQSTAINQPGYTASDAAYSNQSTLSFSGSQWLDGVGLWAVAASQPTTIYVVGEQISSDSAYFTGGAAGSRQALVQDTGDVWSMYAGNAFVDGTTHTTSPSCACAIFNGASSAIYSGASFAAAQGSGNAGASSLTQTSVGALVGGVAKMVGKIAEIVIYSGTHSAGSRAQLRSYFLSRYGI
jgi:hypothetical protein